MESQRGAEQSGCGLDCRVYINVDDFHSLQFSHLYSAAYEEPEWLHSTGGVVTTIGGYTEWVSGDSPAISIGWDWELRFENAICRFVKAGPVFSNIAFQRYEGSGIVTCDENYLQRVLTNKLDTMKWENMILHHIT